MISIHLMLGFALVLAIGSAVEARAAARRDGFRAANDAVRWRVIVWISIATVALSALNEIMALA